MLVTLSLMKNICQPQRAQSSQKEFCSMTCSPWTVPDEPLLGQSESCVSIRIFRALRKNARQEPSHTQRQLRQECGTVTTTCKDNDENIKSGNLSGFSSG